MPAHKRPRGNHHERFFPVEKPGPEDQRQACRIAQAARPDLVISLVSQLLTQEQDLRCDGRSRTGGDTQELQSIAQQFPEDRKAGAEVTLPNASKRRHERSASHKARMLNRVLWPTAGKGWNLQQESYRLRPAEVFAEHNRCLSGRRT